MPGSFPAWAQMAMLETSIGSEPTKEEREARAERYQVRLSTVGESVQVTVEKNINTVAPADVARRVLSAIQDHLG